MPSISELTPREFIDRWPTYASGNYVVLLDVREDEEVATAHVEAALHIPMAEVPSRLNELDRDYDLVVMCHGGMRSMRVAQYLAASGFDRVFNLKGGIDAWSREVDESVPRY
jgi:rhodanese-related sulfurtransferase